MTIAKHFGYPAQAAAIGIINSALQLAQSFGLRLNGGQDAAVTGFVNAIWVFAMALIAYQRNGTLSP